MTKEHLAPDIVELLALFHQHGARVILVGGEAARRRAVAQARHPAVAHSVLA